MLSALLLASSGNSGLLRRSGWTQRARTWEKQMLRSGHMADGRGCQGSASLTWRRKVMGFCPMACASPMLARMTSVKGFFTPWEDGGRDIESGLYHSHQLLSHVTRDCPGAA